MPLWVLYYQCSPAILPLCSTTTVRQVLLYSQYTLDPVLLSDICYAATSRRLAQHGIVTQNAASVFLVILWIEHEP